MKTSKLPLGKFLAKNDLIPVSIAYRFVKRSRQRIGQITEGGLVVVHVVEGVGFVSISELTHYLQNAKPGRRPGKRKGRKVRHQAEQKQLF